MIVEGKFCKFSTKACGYTAVPLCASNEYPHLLYLNAKVSQLFYICFSSVWSMRGYFNDHFLCACTMSKDLP